MHKIVSITLTSLVLGSAALTAMDAKTLHIDDQASFQIVNVLELNDENIQHFFKEEQPGMVLECKKGTTLPLNLSIRGDAVQVDMDASNKVITFLKECYIKCMGETFFFSTDLQNWETFKDFFTGRLSVSVIPGMDVPQLTFDIELNQRT